MSRSKYLICGVAYNDATYVVTKNTKVDGKFKRIWTCPYYSVWFNMIHRCYSKGVGHKNYLNCIVCDEWLTFSNFKSWMETQDWEGKQLDKDILVKGNRVYDPTHCVFVGQAVNKFILESDKARGLLPIGVYWNKRDQIFQAYCRNPFTSKTIFLGTYDCPEEAHAEWLEFKTKMAQQLAATQKDDRVRAAILERYENYEQ